MFAIQCIAFVCFDRSLSSLHIWFVHSLFSFQRSIAHHVLRDCLFIISRLLLSVKPFLKFFQKHYRLADAWISNFYIISRSKSSVNNYFKIIKQLNARQLLYITTKRPSSQCFLETFFQEHVQQLLYNTISIMRLQYFL